MNSTPQGLTSIGTVVLNSLLNAISIIARILYQSSTEHTDLLAWIVDSNTNNLGGYNSGRLCLAHHKY